MSKMNLVKTFLNEQGQPYLVEEKRVFEVDGRKSYNNPELIYNLAVQLDCDKLAEEEIYCLCLNNQLKVVGLFMAGKGTIDGCIFSAREIFQKALLLGAVKIALWHNHPSGEVIPSGRDVEQTKKLKEAGNLIGVELIDHVIIGHGTFTSIQGEGYL